MHSRLRLSVTLFVSTLVFSAATVQARVNFTIGSSVEVDVDPDSGPQSILLADVTGDNVPDLIVASAGEVSVYPNLNDGTGSFGDDLGPFDDADDPVAVVVADVNGDRLPDIIVANNSTGSVTVLLQSNTDGVIDFTRDDNLDEDPATDDLPVGLVIGKIDSGAVLDLAVLSDSSIHLLRGTGAGRFADFLAPSLSFPAGITGGFQIASGDFDNDSNLDLAVTATAANRVIVYFGMGNGVFRSPKQYSVETPQGLVVGDFDGDPSPDIAVVSNQDANSILNLVVSNGAGGFDDPAATDFIDFPPIAIAAADFDNDGKVDLVVTNEGGGIGADVLCHQPSTLCLDPGANGIVPPVLPDDTGFQLQGTVNTGAFGGNYDAATTGDVNRDGLPDIALLNEDGSTVRIVLTTLAAVVETPSPVETVVVNGSPSATPTATVPSATPTQTITRTPTLASIPFGGCNTSDAGQPTFGGKPVAVALGDFDGNGRQDIAVADQQNDRIVIMELKLPTAAPTPTLGPNSTPVSTPDVCARLGLTRDDARQVSVADPTGVATADFNGDGKSDLAVSGSAGLSIVLTTTTGFSSPQLYTLSGGAPTSIAVTKDIDFDRDGVTDIVAVNGSRNVFFFLGQRDGSFQACPPVDISETVTSIYADDFNGDGRLDFAVGSDSIPEIDFFPRIAPTPVSNTPGIASPTPGSRCLSRTDFAFQAVALSGIAKSVAVARFNQTGTTRGLDFAVSLSSYGAPGTPNPTGTPTPGMVVPVLNGGSSNQAISYAAQNPIVLPSQPNISAPLAIASADTSIPLDRRADLVVADRNNDAIFVLYGNGDGSFRLQPTPVPVHPQGTNVAPVALALGDLDGDGVADVVTANEGDGSVSILVTSGRPATPTPPDTETPTTTPTATETALPATPTPSMTGTITLTPSRSPTALPTDTPRGTVFLNGACSIGTHAETPDRRPNLALVAAAIMIGLRRRIVRTMPGLRSRRK